MVNLTTIINPIKPKHNLANTIQPSKYKTNNQILINYYYL